MSKMNWCVVHNRLNIGDGCPTCESTQTEVERLTTELTRLREESESRREVLFNKAQEARQEWVRAENAEAALAVTRQERDELRLTHTGEGTFLCTCTSYPHAPNCGLDARLEAARAALLQAEQERDKAVANVAVLGQCLDQERAAKEAAELENARLREALRLLVEQWRTRSVDKVYPYGKLMSPWAQDAFGKCADELAALASAPAPKQTDWRQGLRQFIERQVDLPPDAAAVLREHFWELLGDEPAAPAPTSREDVVKEATDDFHHECIEMRRNG